MTSALKVKKKWAALLVSVGMGTLLWMHNIAKTSDKEDLRYIAKYLDELPAEYSEWLNSDFQKFEFSKQILLAQAIQYAVLNRNPIGKGIPKNTSRNPKDLYLFPGGECYDRSFVMEKIFTHLQIPNRHVSVFADVPKLSKWQEWLTPGLRSHALTEIKTQKGWMIVEPNARWIGLTKDNQPMSIKKKDKTEWLLPPPPSLNIFYNRPCTYIYGVYSRHGRFFPPFNAIPDYRLQELIYNL